VACLCPCLLFSSNLQAMQQRGIKYTVPITDASRCGLACAHGASFYSSCITGALLPEKYVVSLGCLAVLLQCSARNKIRTFYGISGNACEDCICSACCYSCSLLQEKQQLASNPPGSVISAPLYAPMMARLS
jgi:Cys-rich protein (TIGR01571 family)